MATHAAFIRGINLGPSKRVAMTDLKAKLAEDFEDVQTLLASGNVVLTATGRDSDAVGRAVVDAIEDVAGFVADVTVRTAAEMRTVVADDPFADTGLDGKFRLVAFCDTDAAAQGLLTFEEHAADGERLVVAGRDVYILVPNGQGRSDLMLAMTKARKGPGFATVRNWNTVEKVAAML